MAQNAFSRNIDSSRREDSRKGQMDRCEVIDVHPHVAPYNNGQGDKDFNVVDVQLIDRPRDSDGALCIKRTRLNCAQQYHGLFQGNPWTPRIGDQILVYWLNEREGIVICSITSAEQEPVCRSQACAEHQEIVCKRAAWRPPERNADGNYVVFPPPQHPDCFKWWPVTRDQIFIFDCPNGHEKPSCCKDTPCTCLDDLIRGTYLKLFSDISPTKLDRAWRVKFHHHCGSVWYYDEDGTIYTENRVAEDPRGHVKHDPTGTIDIHSESGDDEGARLMVVADEDTWADEHGSIASEMIHLPTMGLVRVYKDGSVRIVSKGGTGEMRLNSDGTCWLWDRAHDNYVEFKADGTCDIKAVNVNISSVNVNISCANLEATASAGVNFITPVIKRNGEIIHSGGD